MGLERGLLCRLGRRLRGEPAASEQVSLPKLRLGSEYGGYAVLPERLAADSVVYSFGIGDDVSFDLAMIERFGCQVHAFDPTPRALAIMAQRGHPAQLNVHALGLSDRDGFLDFAPPQQAAHVSHRIADAAAGTQRLPVRRLETIMAELGHCRIDVLKMDIEGAEYAVIDALVRSTVRPVQILAEFHHQFRDVPLRRTERALAQLARLGYLIFDRQPGGHEFSLVRDLGD